MNAANGAAERVARGRHLDVQELDGVLDGGRYPDFPKPIISKGHLRAPAARRHRTVGEGAALVRSQSAIHRETVRNDENRLAVYVPLQELKEVRNENAPCCILTTQFRSVG
jgi:hypothetical protein